MKLESNITVKAGHILVELKEVDYWQIWDAIGQAYNWTESYGKDEIWVLSKGPVGLTDAFQKLKDFINDFYPEDVTRSKTAGGINQGPTGKNKISFRKTLTPVTLNLLGRPANAFAGLDDNIEIAWEIIKFTMVFFWDIKLD